jgi:hypothetical protein
MDRKQWLNLAAIVLVAFCAGCVTDRTAPEVTDCSPADGATGVMLNTSIQLTFSEDMEESSVEGAFVLEPEVSGDFTWPGSSSVTFWPTGLLDSNTAYTISLGTGATDRAGNPLAQDFGSGFTTGAETQSGTVYMLGRSVNEGWFEYWGWDWDDEHPVVRGGIRLFHRTIEIPYEGHEMVVSVREVVSAIPADTLTAVFFKFCFADFAGSSQEEAEANLARNKAILDSVVEIVVEEHEFRLILGNALPNTEAETDEFLKWNHAQHNDYINGLAAARDDVFAFDLYGVLADPGTGALRPGFAVGSNDAHLTGAAYGALDGPYDALLQTIFND